MTRNDHPASPACHEQINDLRADVQQRMLELDRRIRSKESINDLERQMQIAGHTMAHVHVTLQGQVGSYNQEWQGLQTQRRQLDIERAILEKDCLSARKDTSIMDGLAALRASVESFYAQHQTEQEQKRKTGGKGAAQA